MEQQFLQRMKDIALRGGEIALGLIEDSSPALKADKSVITRADIEIAGLVRSSLADLLKSPQHLLIDEEDPQNVQYLDHARLESTPFIWVVDPIDGTLSFSHRMPNFAISLGLLKDLKPWLGVTYFPLLKELFFCNGQQSFFVQKAFTDEEKSTLITPTDQTITPQSIFLCSDTFFRTFDWDFSFCHVMSPFCAVIDLCWPAINRGCGSFFKAHLWDFAGSWPIFRSAGLDLRAYTSGQVLARLDVDSFIRQGKVPWKLKDYYILSSERNFPLIKSKINPKVDLQKRKGDPLTRPRRIKVK